jgi:hypothetical protein
MLCLSYWWDWWYRDEERARHYQYTSCCYVHYRSERYVVVCCSAEHVDLLFERCTHFGWGFLHGGYDSGCGGGV